MRNWLWTLALVGATLFDWLHPLPTGEVKQSVAWFIPIIIAAAAAYANKKQKDAAAKDAAKPPQYMSPDQLGIPQFLADGTPNPIWQYLSSGIIPGSGLPTTQTSDTTGFSSTKTDSTTTSKGQTVQKPVYFGSQGVEELIPNLLRSRLASGGKVSPGEQMGVVNSIMQDASLAEKGLVNQLADRGFLGSPVEAGAREGLSRAATGALANYRTQIPSIERARGGEDITLASNVLKQLFQGMQTDTSATSRTVGTSDTGYGSSTTSTTQGPPQFDPRVLAGLLQPAAPSGGSWWGAGADMGQMLMMLYGMGAFDKGKGGAKKTSNSSFNSLGFLPYGGAGA